MKQKIIRLTESDLHNIVRDRVYQILENKQNLDEGWKNWAMAGALGAASMFGNPQTANAQNPIVDDLGDPNEVVGEKYEMLMLDPNKPIKENYAKINSLMSLHKENQYAEYTIMIRGHYTNKRNESYDFPVGMIQVKGKDNERHRTVSGQIINALTELYANSLDEPFRVSPSEYHSMRVNEKQLDVKTGRSYKHQNGDVSTEYVKKGFGLNTFYSLYTTSPLYKKIYNKVIEETGLKDGGSLYDLQQQNERMTNRNYSDVYSRQRDLIDKAASFSSPKKDKKKLNRSTDDDMYFQ